MPALKASQEQHFRIAAKRFGYTVNKSRKTGKWTFSGKPPKLEKHLLPYVTEDDKMPEPKGEYTLAGGYALLSKREDIYSAIRKRWLPETRARIRAKQAEATAIREAAWAAED